MQGVHLRLPAWLRSADRGAGHGRRACPSCREVAYSTGSSSSARAGGDHGVVQPPPTALLALGRRSNLGDAPFKHKPHRELQGARDLATRIEGSAAAKLYEFD